MHPERIGPYLIDRKIGSGGMGNVYHGTHSETGQEVAVKVLPASLAREDGFTQRFSREITALSKLRSPHIVELFDSGETGDGSFYYSMEFVDGETLTSVISNRKKIPWREVIDLSLQIAAALKSAHDAGIVHRDLKPSNLMVSSAGQIKLTDFGVAHVFASTRLTRTGGVVGTAEYMSPEQARGQHATKRSDLYSLGAVMYAMLAGRPPFTGQQASDILHKHQYARFDRPGHFAPDLPRPLEEFVCQLLEKKPDDRFADAFVVIRRLQNIRGQLEYQEKNADAAQFDAELAHTDIAASDRTQEEVISGQQHPGSATMVRDAVRQEIQDQKHRSPLGHFLDNTYVLVALLVIVTGLGIYLNQTSHPSPAEQLATAREVYSRPPGFSWIETRDEIVTPLMESNSLPDAKIELREMAARADQYEFCRRLETSSTVGHRRESEAERLIRRSFELYNDGDPAAATKQLLAVHTMIDGQTRYEYLASFVQSTLDDWAESDDIETRRLFIRSVYNMAAKSTAENSDGTDPAARLKAVIQLYGEDSTVEQEIHQCRELLHQLENQ